MHLVQLKFVGLMDEMSNVKCKFGNCKNFNYIFVMSAMVLHFKVELLNFNFLGLDLAMIIMITYVSSSIFLNGHVFVDFKACLINI